jgi:formylmethanofuran dehydrogenase subunit A
MQEYANEQKAIYDETKNAISTYKSLSEEIDKLTKGTTEWKDKTFEANEEAMKLLETYDTLSYTMKDGRIVIDEDELAEAQAE